MSTTSSDPQPQVIEINYPQADVHLPFAHATNYSHFAQAGFDVQLSIGQVDISRLANYRSSEDGKIKVEAQVTHRFMMSIGTFVQLRQNMDELARRMAEQGIKLPEPFPQDDA